MKQDCSFIEIQMVYTRKDGIAGRGGGRGLGCSGERGVTSFFWYLNIGPVDSWEKRRINNTVNQDR